MSLIRLIEFNEIGDSRGNLVSLEGNNNIPFDIKRLYYIFNTSEGISRGFHAHKKLQQVAICLSGRCRFTLDDGFCREQVVLDSPNVGLYIDNNKWREMDEFSEDCVLLVIASDVYDEDDYIRSYELFKNEVNK
tara:strand:- start:13964 stop:14365 length:402 start_codon:yes stop_codon:yes gene_type:complete